MQAQTDADGEAIRVAALDYIDGWYAGDADRMRRALHIDCLHLAKWYGEQKIVNGLLGTQAGIRVMPAGQVRIFVFALP